jgi:hypothetical protein
VSHGFYELLGIEEDAAADSIRSAYQRRLAQLVRRLRDARLQGADVSILEAQERELRGAMEVLADPVRRRRYDAFRSATVGGMPANAEELWERARASMIDPSSALALALVRALTRLPVGDPVPLPPEHRVQRVPDRLPERPVPRPPPVVAAAPMEQVVEPVVEPEARPTAVPATDSGEGPRPDGERLPLGSALADLAGAWFSPAARRSEVPVEEPDLWDDDYTDGDFGDEEPSAPLTAAVEQWTDADFDDERFDEEEDDDLEEPESLRGPAVRVQVAPPVGAPAPRPELVMPQPSMPTLPRDPVARMAVQHGLTGSFLRAVREHRGMSVDELSRATRISTRYLSAIEDDAHDRLPSATFVRGYLKQVQRTLELGEHDVIDSFMDAYRASRG